MPLIEVEEAELRSAKGAKQVMDQLAGNPKTRAHFLSLLKATNPDLPIPEIDVPMAIGSHVDAKTQKLEERLAAAEARAAEKEANDEVNQTLRSSRRKLRQNGHSDENIEAIEELMVKRGIADYDAAEALWERSKPVETLVESGGGYSSKEWGFSRPAEGDGDHTLLLKDPRAFSDKKVNEVMAELRNNRNMRTA